MLRSIKILLVLVFAINSIGCKTVDEKIATTYYFDAKNGDDNNSGTSSKNAFKSLSKIKDLPLKAGDSILLNTYYAFSHPLELIGISGNNDKKIVVSIYPKNNISTKAKIRTKGFLNAILIRNSSFVEINNITVSALPSIIQKKAFQKEMRCGILVEVTEPKNYQNIYIKNCKIDSVFYEKEGFKRSLKETKSANGTQNYGWGIRIMNNQESSILSNVLIDSCEVSNVAHTGIKFTANRKNFSIQNIKVSNTKVSETGGPGIQMSGVKEGHIIHNIVNKSGSYNDSRKWGRGSGLWTWGSENILIEKNKFTNANGPGDSAGAHIDFNCKNVILQYNLSANNAGGFCEILGNNYNCAYRYNISVNDGYRIKGKNNAFQEGKTLWLSGYNGERKKRKGPYNSYIYNNTIIVDKTIDAKFAITKSARGVLIANNIFYIEGKSKLVKGDQYNPEKNGKGIANNVVFKNNLYLNSSSWPKEMKINDEHPLYEDAKISTATSINILDFYPKNAKSLKNKGIVISKLPNDSLGLFLGLHLQKDILGNVIKDRPDIGAIEIK